ncbi:MAG: tRNA 2-thiouridine(34) synthase MnmA [Chitinispirillaceae bacterium]|nr:tRNA 2-thiouridine(34) synthase MnmA [Chitinispirillaceae bacterium]
MKIAVGMSGGVDSSVAALLLKKEGHDVTGVTMKIWRNGRNGHTPKGNACYGSDEERDIERTEKLCKSIGIGYRVIDCSEQYETIVLDYFRKEYRSGRTPNPCVKCNQEIKFGVFPELAKKAGLRFDRFVTGHYARTSFDTGRNRWLLMKGLDSRKDQSYFLYRLSQEQLAVVHFPLGGLKKDDVRKIAKEAGLAVHDKEESQDFYSGDYADIVGEKSLPGDIVDASGAVLGKHSGIWNYTVGQRKGLGVAFREPLYVLSIDAEKNRVVAGTEKEARRSVFTVTDCSWIALEKPEAGFSAKVKIRSATPEAACTIEPMDDNSLRVSFSEPHSGITPGQSAVFYDNDLVLGGGIIDKIEQ